MLKNCNFSKQSKISINFEFRKVRTKRKKPIHDQYEAKELENEPVIFEKLIFLDTKTVFLKLLDRFFKYFLYKLFAKKKKLTFFEKENLFEGVPP